MTITNTGVTGNHCGGYGPPCHWPTNTATPTPTATATPTPTATVTPTPTATATPTPTATITPTPTATTTVTVTSTPTEVPVGGSLPVTGPGTGVLVAAATVFILGGLALRRVRRQRPNA